MAKELDLDDVCAGNPLAERQLAELRAEARAEAGKAAYNHAEVFQRRLASAQEALLKYPSIVTKLVRGYGIDVNEKQIMVWLERELAAILADEPKEERGEEAGWMIEKPGPIVMWWNGRPKREGNGAWSSDSNDGIRFCRRFDAELCAIAQGFSLSKVLITEHRWG